MHVTAKNKKKRKEIKITLPKLPDLGSVQCQAVRCLFNIGRKCATPSHCIIGIGAACTGFVPKRATSKSYAPPPEHVCDRSRIELMSGGNC